jgi:hypothetical protein
MKIREGAYYRTRGEQIVGPMRKRDGRSPYPWGDGTDVWTDNGRFSEDVNDCDMDLISEVYVSDTPPADTPAPEAQTLRDDGGAEEMTEKKEGSLLGIIGMLYLCAVTIGTLIGTVAYFAALTFFAYDEVFTIIRKMGAAIMQVLT